MTKDEVRARTAASRAQRSIEQIQAAGHALAAQPWQHIIPDSNGFGNESSRGFIGCYAAMPGEPPTDEVIAVLTKLSWRVVLPIMSPSRQLTWGWHSSALKRNNFGVLQPQPDPTISLTDAIALLIPAQRVGLDGSRLGRGAGYYDRALAELPAHRDGGPLRIAVVFDDEIEASVPHDNWDQPVDLIVTPIAVHTVIS